MIVNIPKEKRTLLLLFSEINYPEIKSKPLKIKLNKPDIKLCFLLKNISISSAFY